MKDYIKFDAEKKVFFVSSRPGDRPNNQSDREVLIKIARRLRRFEHDLGAEFTDPQKILLERVNDTEKWLKKNKIDTAHNISIKQMAETIIAVMNQQIDLVDPASAEPFADALLSTDDETGRAKFSNFLDRLESPTISAAEKLPMANEIIEHFNRASRNLMPGNASANRGISDDRDPHLVKINGAYQETPTSKALDQSFQKLSLTPYSPQTRTKAGKIELRSSSVDLPQSPVAASDKGWYQPHLTDSESEEELDEHVNQPQSKNPNDSGIAVSDTESEDADDEQEGSVTASESGSDRESVTSETTDSDGSSDEESTSKTESANSESNEAVSDSSKTGRSKSKNNTTKSDASDVSTDSVTTSSERSSDDDSQRSRSGSKQSDAETISSDEATDSDADKPKARTSLLFLKSKKVHENDKKEHHQSLTIDS